MPQILDNFSLRKPRCINAYFSHVLLAIHTRRTSRLNVVKYNNQNVRFVLSKFRIKYTNAEKRNYVVSIFDSSSWDFMYFTLTITFCCDINIYKMYNSKS